MGVIEAGRSHEPGAIMHSCEELRALIVPSCCVINKIDLMPRVRLLPCWRNARASCRASKSFRSARKTGENVEELLRVLKSMLPEGPALMSEDEYTDQTERTLAEEIVREKFFLKLMREDSVFDRGDGRGVQRRRGKEAHQNRCDDYRRSRIA